MCEYPAEWTSSRALGLRGISELSGRVSNPFVVVSGLTNTNMFPWIKVIHVPLGSLYWHLDNDISTPMLVSVLLNGMRKTACPVSGTNCFSLLFYVSSDLKITASAYFLAYAYPKLSVNIADNKVRCNYTYSLQKDITQHYKRDHAKYCGVLTYINYCCTGKENSFHHRYPHETACFKPLDQTCFLVNGYHISDTIKR